MGQIELNAHFKRGSQKGEPLFQNLFECETEMDAPRSYRTMSHLMCVF